MFECRIGQNTRLANNDDECMTRDHADDILLIMEACSRQLWALKALLQTFGDSTGLRVNYAKSIMVPINTPQANCNIWLELSTLKLAVSLLLTLGYL
jgi:hypothetical protein